MTVVEVCQHEVGQVAPSTPKYPISRSRAMSSSLGCSQLFASPTDEQDVGTNSR